MICPQHGVGMLESERTVDVKEGRLYEIRHTVSALQLGALFALPGIWIALIEIPVLFCGIE